MTITEIVVLLIATIGVLVSLLSAIGVLRLPDVYTRMHAAGKSATLGISTLMIAAGIYYPDYLGRMVVLVILFYITAPIASTTMARAAYRSAKAEDQLVLLYDEMAKGKRDV